MWRSPVALHGSARVVEWRALWVSLPVGSCGHVLPHMPERLSATSTASCCAGCAWVLCELSARSVVFPCPRCARCAPQV